MKLLIVTQTVDTEDPVLGFFVRWIEELAKHCEQLEVICLREGKHNFYSAKNAVPRSENSEEFSGTGVRVYSLGKPASRLRYVFYFYKYIFSLDYDAVFVHMNQEYVILGGLFWRLWGKKVILWRNHKMGSWLTRLAAAFSNAVCYTSPDAFVARYKNARRMPIGIDTDFFAPTSPAPADSILFLGRLDPVKKTEKFVEALAGVPVPFHADIYGSPTLSDSPYVRQITAQAQPLIQKGVLVMHPGVPYERTRELYQSHTIYVNLTPSGSFDKTIGEAAAAGCVVVCANRAMERVVSPALIVRDDDSEDVARGVSAALSLSQDERAAETRKLRSYIEEHHSLQLLTEKLEHEL